MKFFFVFVVGMFFGSFIVKFVKDFVFLRYYYDDESNDYFDVGKLFLILYCKWLFFDF